jgi:hypothetical protein
MRRVDTIEFRLAPKEKREGREIRSPSNSKTVSFLFPKQFLAIELYVIPLRLPAVYMGIYEE